MSVMQRPERARLYALWDRLVERLNASATIAAALRGGTQNPARARVYGPDVDYSGEQGAEGTPWGRVILLPSQGILPTPALPAGRRRRPVRFTLRSDVNAIADAGFDPYRTLERVQIETDELLRGYAPQDLPGLRVVTGIRLSRPWEEGPLRDEASPMWYVSSEYALDVTSAP